METADILRYALIAGAVIVCISLKLYFGDNAVVVEVDKGVEIVVKDESGYDITPIVDAV